MDQNSMLRPGIDPAGRKAQSEARLVRPLRIADDARCRGSQPDPPRDNSRQNAMPLRRSRLATYIASSAPCISMPMSL